MSEALTVRPGSALSEWGGAAERGLQARQERERIISTVLKAESDFGIIPGTNKPTLLKPGAEKIADSLNLYPDYEPISTVENFEAGLFSYRYRCHLRQRGTDTTIATGIGSCNSMEARYRWRKGERVCPKCGQATIIKGKEEYGGGWLCFAKKGGCGAKYAGDDVRITSQSAERVANDDIFSLVNTVDKMAQKRALVAAALNLGFSEQFTQDVEDLPEQEAVPVRRVVPDEAPARPASAPGDFAIPFAAGGAKKGQMASTLTADSLKSWIEIIERDLKNPAKAQYKVHNDAHMRFLLAEKTRRAQNAMPEEPPFPSHEEADHAIADDDGLPF